VDLWKKAIDPLRLSSAFKPCTAMMKNVSFRIIALLLHVVVSFLCINWFLNFDITGKWIFFIGFIIVLLALMYLLVKHVIAFLYFLKTKLK
jgi:undecaprenyl pyrophosphate phosphatase UppP